MMGPGCRTGIFSREHDLKIITIQDLIEYRFENESFVHRRAETRSRSCTFKAIVYENDVDEALVKGEINPRQEI